jgi:hypothetical protein
MEDKNMLVYVEATKTIELMVNLLGANFQKPAAKIKTYITLIVSKYGETKTAVLAAVDRCLQALLDSRAVEPKVFTEFSVN